MNAPDTEKADRYLQQLYELEQCKQTLSRVMVFLLNESGIANSQPVKKTAKAKLVRIK